MKRASDIFELLGLGGGCIIMLGVALLPFAIIALIITAIWTLLQ